MSMNNMLCYSETAFWTSLASHDIPMLCVVHQLLHLYKYIHCMCDSQQPSNQTHWMCILLSPFLFDYDFVGNEYSSLSISLRANAWISFSSPIHKFVYLEVLCHTCVPSIVSDRQVGDVRAHGKRFDYKGKSDFEKVETVRMDTNEHMPCRMKWELFI